MYRNGQLGDKVTLIGERFEGGKKEWAQDGALVLIYDSATNTQATIVGYWEHGRYKGYVVELDAPNFGRLKVRPGETRRVK